MVWSGWLGGSIGGDSMKGSLNLEWQGAVVLNVTGLTKLALLDQFTEF